jgi:hypothetical protein
MAQLAQEARTNGDPILVTYGYTPNNPKVHTHPSNFSHCYTLKIDG